MAVRTGKLKTETFYTVVFERPNKKTGKMQREVSDYVDDLAWFRSRIEKSGGKIISIGGPRVVESIPVYL